MITSNLQQLSFLALLDLRPVFGLTDARILQTADGSTAEQSSFGVLEDAAVQSED